MFGFPEPARLAGASSIVLSVDNRLVGQDVRDEIAPTPEFGARAIGAAIAGIGTPRGDKGAGDRSVLLLDVDHVMRRVREDSRT